MSQSFWSKWANLMIYLDNNATTCLDPEVLEVMKPFFTTLTGNPSSVHRFGQKAKGALTEATRHCARFFNVRPEEIIFTSGATEALNFLIRSTPRSSHIITSSLEHAAVLEPLKFSGCQVTYLEPYPGQGAIEASQVEQVIQENTRLIVLTAVNNETGVKTDLGPIAALAERHQIPFLVDGVAWLGKELVTLPRGISAVCFSGHKVHGPLGVGLAIVRKPFRAHPFLVGGGQQRGFRAGTENLPAIAGFAKALELLSGQGEKWIQQMTALRDRFEKGLQEAIPDLVIHGQENPRVCNTSHIAFPGVDGETLLMMLDLAGLASSHGAACSTGTLEPSRVLLNMGIDPALARSSLRFSLSRYTTHAEIDAASALIIQTVAHHRQLLTVKE